MLAIVVKQQLISNPEILLGSTDYDLERNSKLNTNHYRTSTKIAPIVRESLKRAPNIETIDNKYKLKNSAGT